MKTAFITVLCYISVMVHSHQPTKPIVIDENCQEVLALASYDSKFVNPVSFCQKDGYGYYTTDLKTTVCSDELCRLATLRVFWDLAGRYVRFDTLPGEPLTKYDHKPFTRADYEKLHQTLSDKGSILKEKSKEELLSQSDKRYSHKVDGWTGATRKEIKSAVVDGALYSTHTLWHLINGKIGDQIKANTLAIYDSAIEKQLLQSHNPDAVVMVLGRWDEETYIEQFEKIATLLKRGDIRINFYIAQNLPDHTLSKADNRREMKEVWPYLDEYSQSIMPNPF